MSCPECKSRRQWYNRLTSTYGSSYEQATHRLYQQMSCSLEECMHHQGLGWLGHQGFGNWGPPLASQVGASSALRRFFSMGIVGTQMSMFSNIQGRYKVINGTCRGKLSLYIRQSPRSNLEMGKQHRRWCLGKLIPRPLRALHTEGGNSLSHHRFTSRTCLHHPSISASSGGIESSVIAHCKCNQALCGFWCWWPPN
jgi:hypothetical protein